MYQNPDDNSVKMNVNNNNDEKIEADAVVADNEMEITVSEESVNGINHDSKGSPEICLTKQKQGSSLQATTSSQTLQTLFGPLDPDLLEDTSMEESEEIEPETPTQMREKLKRKKKTKKKGGKRKKCKTDSEETTFHSEEERKKIIEEFQGSPNIKTKVTFSIGKTA